MIEGHRLEREGSRPAREVAERNATGRRRALAGREHDRAGERRQRFGNCAHVGTAVEVLSSVAVAVHRDEEFRFDLAEAVEHAFRAEFGGRARENGTETRRGEKERDRFGAIGQERRHTIAAADAEVLETGATSRDEIPERVLRELRACSVFGDEDERRRIATGRFARAVARSYAPPMNGTIAPPIDGTECVLGVVQRRAGKPTRARHATLDDGAGRRVPAHAEVRGERAPKCVEVLRPTSARARRSSRSEVPFRAREIARTQRADWLRRVPCDGCQSSVPSATGLSLTLRIVAPSATTL